MTCLTGALHFPDGHNKNLEPKAEFIRSVRFPEKVTELECWRWIADDVEAARRKAYRLWNGDCQDLPVLTNGDCHPDCVFYVHLSLPGIPVETFEAGNAGDKGELE